MRYILLIELESTGFTSCKIQGLTPGELLSLQKELTDLHLISSNQEDFFETDTRGVLLLNILSKMDYRVSSQSMVIEKSNVGGRTVQVQKVVWTLCKE